MVDKVFTDVSDVIDNYSGRCRVVLEYSQLMGQLVEQAKQPGFSEASWAPLEEMIAVDEFSRIGNFKEQMNYAEYVAFLTGWAMSSDWECSFKRVTEHDGVVFLELEERSRFGDFSSVVNSISVYEFNAAGKIRHIDIYLQMELPPQEMLQNYEGVID